MVNYLVRTLIHQSETKTRKVMKTKLDELSSGVFYNVTFGNGAPNFTRNGVTVPLRFNKSFPCYDARFHGATSDPELYRVFEFQLPEKLGIWSAYRFQILTISES